MNTDIAKTVNGSSLPDFIISIEKVVTMNNGYHVLGTYTVYKHYTHYLKFDIIRSGSASNNSFNTFYDLEQRLCKLQRRENRTSRLIIGVKTKLYSKLNSK